MILRITFGRDSNRLFSLVFLPISLFVLPVSGYYKIYSCYGVGACEITIHTGGIPDDIHRWAVECHDGEAMTGLDGVGGFGTAWCKFMFPKKKPSFGIYPYYEYCNVRDVSIMKEYYCYDRFYPYDTYDTFVTAYDSTDVYKCCKLPHGYHLDYSRCEYKYSHDRWGEPYDENTMWPTRCDRDYLLTGIGKAMNPWTEAMNYVWSQCCPVFYDPAYIPLFVRANETLHQEQAGEAHQTYYTPTANSQNYG
ncbi:hypothetical protein BV898_01400 [Hypsibius exemplaris]|uniref:Uncharacterized protein n=1 Tax=Hypsibius exemplaris TaxID=2072580 RepID=A0A1W0XBL2_HYPEX|nr:hypothetical protein BV898_01400 [Hypsibius exemplaris]